MRFFVFVFIFSWAISLNAMDWQSPIDIKYKAKDPGLFLKYSKARGIVDLYSGDSKDLEKAHSILIEVLNTDSEFAPAFRELGRLIISAGHINYKNFKKGSLEASEKAILQSIKIEPKYADSYVLLGHLYTLMQKYDSAQGSLEKAEMIGTKLPWLNLNWAALLKKQGKKKEAFNRYRKVVQEGTSNKKAYASALSGITQYFIKKRDYEKARTSYLAEIKYNPELAWNYGNYADFLLFKYGDVDASIKNSKKALEIMNYGMGRFTLACAMYTKWAELRKTNATSKVAAEYFKNAWDLYPYPEKVIDKTKRHRTTLVTANALQNWVNRRSRK